jgi:CDP-diacylglycerol--glycerol-3-phosphate 3-phosphatidyltransferase
LPNVLTLSRIILAPFFFILVFFPVWTGFGFLPCYITLWLLFLYIEISDIADGHLARRMGLVSDLGKILDPFSDVVSRLTYFVAFVTLGIMPGWMLIIILYRELSINFMRSVLFGRGIAMAARRGGKLKATLYGVAGGAGLLVMGMRGFQVTGLLAQASDIFAMTVFSLALAASVLSFIDYLVLFARLYRQGQAKTGE